MSATRSVGDPESNYSTHSIRLGSATALLSCRADSLSIKLLGRWMSRCDEDYRMSRCYKDYPVQAAATNGGRMKPLTTLASAIKQHATVRASSTWRRQINNQPNEYQTIKPQSNKRSNKATTNKDTRSISPMWCLTCVIRHTSHTLTTTNIDKLRNQTQTPNKQPHTQYVWYKQI